MPFLRFSYWNAQKKKNPTFWQYSSDSLDRKHQQQKSSKKTKKLEMKNSKKLETQLKLLKTDFFYPGNETTPRAGKNQIFWRKSCVSGTFQSIGSIPNSNRDFPMDIDERETSVKREDFSCWVRILSRIGRSEREASRNSNFRRGESTIDDRFRHLPFSMQKPFGWNRGSRKCERSVRKRVETDDESGYDKRGKRQIWAVGWRDERRK